jgi:hypothetical protein
VLLESSLLGRMYFNGNAYVIQKVSSFNSCDSNFIDLRPILFRSGANNCSKPYTIFVPKVPRLNIK